MIKFAEPNPEQLIEALSEAILISRRTIPSETHLMVQRMYSWTEVAKRTETVYKNIIGMEIPPLSTRFLRYLTVGPFAGLAVCFIVACMHFLNLLCTYLWPAEYIEEVPDLTFYYGGTKKSQPGVSSTSHSSRKPINSTTIGEQKNISS